MSTPRPSLAALAAALLLCHPLPSAAQILSTAGFDAAVARVHFHGSGSGIGESLSGFAAEGRASVLIGPVTVRAAYGQGHLVADSAAAVPRDLVAGSLFLSASPAPWLVVAAGPRLIAYAASGTTERWVHWEAHARFRGPIIVGTLRAHAEGWLALASSVNAAAGAGSAGGGEAGLTMLIPHTALWARFAYVVDQARLKTGARSETLESVVLGVGLGAR